MTTDYVPAVDGSRCARYRVTSNSASAPSAAAGKALVAGVYLLISDAIASG